MIRSCPRACMSTRSLLQLVLSFEMATFPRGKRLEDRTRAGVVHDTPIHHRPPPDRNRRTMGGGGAIEGGKTMLLSMQ